VLMAAAATPARSFALRLIGWSLGLFGLFRLPWIAAHILLPVTARQAAAATALLGPSSLPIEVTLACSGADALALCFAAILAYPARWTARAAGLALGAAGLLTLNTVRIGTLGRVAASPRVFDALHLYIWPAALTIAVAAFVFGWMRAVDAGRNRNPANAPAVFPARQLPATPSPFDWVTWRFALTTAVLLFLFVLGSPLYLESARVLAAAQLVALAAASLLRLLGMNARAAGGVLTTPVGAFLVTQECVSTPLIPIYAAAILVYSRTRWHAAWWMIAGVPLFFALGVARLMVVALPAWLAGSPAFLIHAFSQLLVATGMICGVALWRYGARPATCVRVVAALGLAIAFVVFFGASYTHAIRWFDGGAFADAQGALAFLPAFQAGLFLALWVAGFVPSGWTRFVYGAALLVATQIAISGGVQLLLAHAGVAPLVRDIRAWALIGPALSIAMVTNIAPARP
jgi:exosortase/archaeosortase family protein